MKSRKAIPALLAGVLSTSMVVPAFAATNSMAAIDTERTGTLNIHKIIENDGNNVASDGLANPDENRVPVNDIGFDYIKIATIDNINGIVISKDGKIDLSADGGYTSTGTYYIGTEALEKLIAETGITPEATYIKTKIRDGGTADMYPTIEYDYNDQVDQSFLKADQETVSAAKTALDTAKNEYLVARNAYTAAVVNANIASTASTSKAKSLENAQAAADKAAEALAKAQESYKGDGSGTAEIALETAKAKAEAAQEALDAAQEAFDAAMEAFTGDEGTRAALKAAQEALNTARAAQVKANAAYVDAQTKSTEAADKYAKAEAAQAAADKILDDAETANAGAATGEFDSINATNNAVTWATEQLENADAYLAEAEAAATEAGTKLNEADEALAAAKTALQTATETLNNAQTSDDAASAEYLAAKNALAKADSANDEAIDAQEAAQSANDSAKTATDNAQATNDAAQATLAQAKTDSSTATDTSTAADTAKDAAEAAMNEKKASYEAAVATYNAAVATLDADATAGGVTKVYTAKQLQDMMSKILASLSEETVNEFVKLNGEYAGEEAGQYTDDNGTVTFSGMDLGMYLVAETDTTAHDGIAGAWYDGKESNSINNDQMNTVDTTAGTYTITATDGFGQSVVHTYTKGEAYRESVSPEAPVVESAAAPFIVSLPTTNSVITSADTVAAGDNYGEAGTVWQYTVDVYPKNQTTAIYKRIIDPDETDGLETLRTSEDYQSGDTIEQVIWADAPALQPNGLDETAAGNKHIDFVLSDTMTEGITLDEITAVRIIPASQLKGDNVNEPTYIYTNAEGTRVSEAEATNEDGSLKTKIKYYGANSGDEITEDQFIARTGVTNPTPGVTYPVVDGVTYEKYDGQETWDQGGYYCAEVSYKKVEVSDYVSALPSKATAFDADTEGTSETLVKDVDYKIIDTNTTDVVMVNSDGKTERVIEAGTNGWAVQLTEAGLAKLNARTSDSTVCVFFKTHLNEKAKIGQVAENMNFGTLRWSNSNTSIRKVSSNEVYNYTYELQLKKQGVTDASNVKFIVSRTDANDINQAYATDTDYQDSKDMTDTVAGIKSVGQDDSMRFVKESDGVYHVYNGASDGTAETTVVNGTTYFTLTPAADGTLRIKGLDSNTYTFKEIKTEAGKNLLKSSFDVNLVAPDSATDSARDGRLIEATVSMEGGNETDITIGVVGSDAQDANGAATNLGIAAMAVNNYDVVDLRTGGAGRTMIYLGGLALLGMMGAGVAVSNKKRREAED